MKCFDCGNEEVLAKPNQTYHYTECGLENVYLEGVELLVCEQCGAVSPIIPKIEELHSRIAQTIINNPGMLSGSEVKFLRKQLGVKARDWALYIRIDPSTLSRWENENQQIGPQSDMLVRMLYQRLKAGEQIPVSMPHTQPQPVRINVNELQVA